MAIMEMVNILQDVQFLIAQNNWHTALEAVNEASTLNNFSEVENLFSLMKQLITLAIEVGL
jgi:hypothetical protein